MTAIKSIHAREILKLKERLIEMLVQHTGQDQKKILKDTDRNFFMDAVQAKEYGIVDSVYSPDSKNP